MGGQNQFLKFVQDDMVHWCCRSGEGDGSPSPVTPHPYLHHAKGCGNCYISDMTVLYTHIILICHRSKWLELDGNFPTEEFSIWKCWLDWIEVFCGKVLIPSKLSVETKQALARMSDGQACLESCQLTHLPTCAWTFWLCGYKISQMTGSWRPRHQLGTSFRSDLPVWGQLCDHTLSDS